MDGQIENQDDTPSAERKRRWLRPSPDRFVLGLLLTECLLWLSERFQWFGFNHHKGWTVLIAVATVVVAGLVMLFWWDFNLAFRWRYKFRIRSLLAFCVATAIGVSWLAREASDARRQAELVRQIRNSGGRVEYDWMFDASGVRILGRDPPRLEPPLGVLGVDFFSIVTTVSFAGTEIRGSNLAHLVDLPRLVGLDLSRTHIGDDELQYVARLPQLQWLELSDARITDDGLKYITGLKQLQLLGLAGTRITAVGLEHFKALTHLSNLDLSDTTVTDADLDSLKGITQLRCLFLNSTRATDVGVKGLEEALPNCHVFR